MWASEGFNRSATTANSGMLSPHEVFFGGCRPMPVLTFCKPAYHRVPRRRKIDPQARPRFFWNFGYNHGSDWFKVMDTETGRVVHSCDVTWHQPREPLIFPAPTVGSRVSYLSSGAEPPDYVYIQPPPVATATPAATPASAPATAAPMPASAPPLVTAPAPTPPSNSPVPVPDRVVRELGYKAEVRMPGRTRGETRAMRYSYRSMGLMSHGVLAQKLATREVFDEAFREHGLPKAEIYFPTAPASDLPAPSTVDEAESSEHADIWRRSRTREFNDLLQATLLTQRSSQSVV